MKSKDGEKTGEFGLWLRRYLKENDQYSVYYDHGDKAQDPNVATIKGFFGQQVTRRNRLADLDVMIVDNDRDEVVLLIEIEETESPPKKLLGDVFAMLMCNQIAVKIETEQRYFSLSPQTQLIVAGTVSSRGAGREKIRNTIAPRLQQFDVPSDSIQIDQIKFVFGEDVFEVIEELKNEVRSSFAVN